MCYIQGTKPKYARKEQYGCNDDSPPEGDEKISVPFELYFAGNSNNWYGGGVAYIKSTRDETGETLGRMYLITEEQFLDVMLQENNRNPKIERLEIDLNEVKRSGKFDTKLGLYGLIIHLGSKDGHEIFTITNPTGHSKSEINAPGENYLKTIAEGLRDKYQMSDKDILKYFKGLEGIKNRSRDDWLEAFIRSKGTRGESLGHI